MEPAQKIPATDRLMEKKGYKRRGLRQRAAGDSGRLDFLPQYYAWIFAAGAAGLILYYIIINPNHKTPETLWLASAVFTLACLPMTLFLRRGRTYQIPVLEAHGMFYALCFGLPGFLAQPELASNIAVNEADVQQGLLATLLGLLSLLVGYYLAGSALFKTVRLLQPGQHIPANTFHWLAWAGCGVGLGLETLSRELTILATLGQVGEMLYYLGFFGLLLLALEQRSGLAIRLLVYFILLPVALLMNSGLENGQLAIVVKLLCWISLVVMRTKKRVPVELLTAAFLIFIILQPVKFYVRNLAWNEGVNLGPVQTIKAYARGFRETYGSADQLMTQPDAAFNNSFTRINHLITTAAIIRDTPAREPFIMGDSYQPLLTKWIPRAIWPDKPEENFGHDWAKRYGYLGENDDTTSFNLPWLPEMFMNFGWYGVVGIMFMLGLIYRYLWNVLLSQPQNVVSYTIAIVFAQSIVFTESNLSMQLGGPIIFIIFLWFLGKGLGFAGVRINPVLNRRTRKKGLAFSKMEKSGLK